MSARDVIEKILRNNTSYVTQDDISSSPMVKTPKAIFEEDISDVADQILDSLPKLSKSKVEEIIWDNWEGVTIDIVTASDQICALIPEHKWVQTTDDKDNVIVPLGEVIAKGIMKIRNDSNGMPIIDIENDIGNYIANINYYVINSKLIKLLENYQKGILVWIPDKEIENDKSNI